MLSHFHPRKSQIRYVRYESVIPGPTGQINSFDIPVYCPLGEGSLWMSAPSGTRVFLKARLDYDKEVGLILIHEFDEFLSAAKRQSGI